MAEKVIINENAYIFQLSFDHIYELNSLIATFTSHQTNAFSIRDYG